jgi:hypothetical protein
MDEIERVRLPLEPERCGRDIISLLSGALVTNEVTTIESLNTTIRFFPHSLFFLSISYICPGADPLRS